MRFNKSALALAATIAWAVLFTLCALLVAIWPEQTTAIFGAVMHVDLSSMDRTVTWPGFCFGLIASSILVWVTVWLTAGLYNLLAAPEARDASNNDMKTGQALQ